MNRRGNLISGVLWMSLIAALLFWLPCVGPFWAGLVGGNKSGGLGNALLAVVLPGLIVGVLLVLFSAGLTGLPLIGVLVGTWGTLLYLSHVGMLLVGAIIGGLFA